MGARADRSRWPDDPGSHRIGQTYAKLLDQIQRALSAGSGERLGPMTRLEVDAPPIDLLGWLAAQHRLPRLFWSDRDGSRRMAGVGFADRLDLRSGMAPAALLQRAAGRLAGRDPALRYYGGFRFDVEGAVSAQWSPFGRGWLVLPRFEWVERDGRFVFACNVFPGRDSAERVADELRLLSCGSATLSMPAGRPSRSDVPSQEDWQSRVERAASELRTTTLRKIVLARRSDWQFAAHVPALALLRALAQRCGSCFQFCFDIDGESAFVGATPERLLRRVGRELWTEALAGTRPRALDAAEDEHLRRELLHCAKEAREHGLVVHHLVSRLAPLVRELARDPTVSVARLPHVQHLRLSIRCRLDDTVSDAMLLEALNPTPAVAGDPPLHAIERIRAMEPFDRGWYAGPVGFIGSEESEFAVAIRSALVQRRTVSLYVGAGIVDGSRAADEWRELESKSAAVESGWADG